MTRPADTTRGRIRTLATSTAAVLLLSGGSCDAAFEREEDFFFLIDVPKLEHPQQARFGPTDTEALGLESPIVSTIEGPTFDYFRVFTSLAESTAQGAEYCFVEPVMLIEDATESVLVEPGVCVHSGNRSIDRTGDETPDP